MVIRLRKIVLMIVMQIVITLMMIVGLIGAMILFRRCSMRHRKLYYIINPINEIYYTQLKAISTFYEISPLPLAQLLQKA